MTDPLAEEPYAWRATRDGTVFVTWQGRVVRTYRGREAERLLARLERASPRDVQLALARITGHFKHGNERR